MPVRSEISHRQRGGWAAAAPSATQRGERFFSQNDMLSLRTGCQALN